MLLGLGRWRPSSKLLGVTMLVGLLFQSAGTTASGADPPGSDPGGVVRSYLAAWSHRHYSAMAALVDRAPSTFVAFNRQIADSLDLDHANYRMTAIDVNGDQATASVTERLVLVPFGPVVVKIKLPLRQGHGRWRIEWSPTTILPQLKPGDSVMTTVSWPPRAPILGRNGVSLTTEAPMVRVGIEGARISDPAGLTTALEQVGAAGPAVTAALQTATAHPTWFVPVLDLPQAIYEQVKPEIYPVPGTVFESYSARTAITPDLAAHLVGSVGPITADQLTKLGRPYQATDSVGQDGIEAAYERQLAGTPGGSVAVTTPAGSTVATIARFLPRPGKPVTTSIDPGLQQAAEGALGGVTQAAALVASQPSTGNVLASVSLPGSDSFDIALSGAYPPGSTFKVITAADLLEHGAGPSTQASCPPTITVGGETFHNFEGEAQTSLSLQDAFAESCNSAFIGLASQLPDASFSSTASQFGIGTPPQLGLPAIGGSVPPPASDTERAATAIGQGKVSVSPLNMAVVAATVASGSLRLPRLVQGARDDTVLPRPLTPPVVNALQTMMAAVVTDPNGTASGAGLPPGTFGKTGTAEFGTATPPQTHAWFIGYRGDLAFAVLVVGGGVGGSVAAPIAARFLETAGSA